MATLSRMLKGQRIYARHQHPYTHDISDFYYSHAALPGLSHAGEVLDWILAVLYPNSQDAVADVASLPSVGNTINDYRVVLDDGDGRMASYRWEQREGDVSASWYKVYDLDWSSDSILSGLQDKVQDVYVHKYGRDDLDSSGSALAGDDAGQSIYGGTSANSHLTLYANSGDGTGAATGYIQFGDNARPKTDSAFTLGTATYRFSNVYSDTSTIGTLTLTDGSITDSGGSIDFGDENLSTSGNMTIGTMLIAAGSITDTSGAISFGNENLSTTGSITATTVASAFASGTTIGNLTLANGSITDSGGTIDFGDEHLTTTGNLTANDGTLTTASIGQFDFITNSVTINTLNADMVISANGTGVVDINSAMVTLGQTIVGDVGITGAQTITGSAAIDNLSLNGNTLTTITSGDLILDSFTNEITTGSLIYPDADNALDLGKTASRFQTLYLGTSIHDGTNEFTIGDFMALRSTVYRDAGRTQPAQSGDGLFYDGSQWLASVPDTEIDHATVSGLTTGDAGHTQFAMLAGRSGGQTIYGGTAASDNLTLISTSNASLGNIVFGSNFIPDTDATYDFGTASFRIANVYSSGQFTGFRFQNATTAGAPSASAGSIGRGYYNTDENNLYLDQGGTWKRANLQRYENQDAVNWDGSISTYTYTVSSDIDDARFAIWAFLDNANDFEQLGVEITKSATQVTVTAAVNLPSGTYTLVGIY